MKVFIVASIAAILFVGTVFGGSAAENKDPVCLVNNFRTLLGQVTFIDSIKECLGSRDISEYDQDVNRLEQGVENGRADLDAVEACEDDKCKCKALDKLIRQANSIISCSNDLQAKIKEQSNNPELDECIAVPIKRVNDKINEALDCPKQE